MNKVIKASAGTGKTYRLSLEYLASLIKGLDFSEIIVMTFTKKATAEIRERIFSHIKAILNESEEKGEIITALKEIYPELSIDKEMIKTVLRSLVTNAIKYTYAQGRVKVTTSQQDDGLRFTVSDTGMGIPPKYQDQLFEIDCGLSHEGTQNEKGSGLGLVLCKEFVEKHGGAIWVESELGKGTAFHFTIPF